MGWLLVLALLPGPFGPSDPKSPAEALGDRAWRTRAKRFAANGVVDPGPAATAVQAYESALRERPDDLELRFKLMEALYFEGYFTVTDRRKRKRIDDRLLDLAQDTVRTVERGIGEPDAIERLPLEERARRLRDTPEAARAHFWSAIGWGLWAMSHGNLAAATHNAAGKIRDHARLVTLIDVRYADGGGLRLLGRLHAVTPRVPLFTGWIDRRKGVELLERANAISTGDPRNPLFLAEAILEVRPRETERAVELLREVAARTPDPEYLVEQSETIERARELLGELGRSPRGSP